MDSRHLVVHHDIVHITSLQTDTINFIGQCQLVIASYDAITLSKLSSKESAQDLDG